MVDMTIPPKEYHIVKNFINRQECDEIKNHILNNLSHHDLPNFKYFETTLDKRKSLEKIYYDYNGKLQEIADIAVKWFEQNFNISGLTYDRTHGSIMYKDAELPYHTDEKNNEHPEYGPGDAYVCILFITDDYQGGELKLKDCDLIIKPEAGDAIFFPGWKIHHGVEKVIDGVRINLITHFFGPRYVI